MRGLTLDGPGSLIAGVVGVDIVNQLTAPAMPTTPPSPTQKTGAGASSELYWQTIPSAGTRRSIRYASTVSPEQVFSP
jgi:hypothetical protein